MTFWESLEIYIDTHRFVSTVIGIITGYMVIQIILGILESWGVNVQFIRSVTNPINDIVSGVFNLIFSEFGFFFIIGLSSYIIAAYLIHPGRKYFYVWIFEPLEYLSTPFIVPFTTHKGVKYIEGKPLVTVGDPKFTLSTKSGVKFELAQAFGYIEEEKIWFLEYEDIFSLTPREYVANIKLIALHAEMEESLVLENLMYQGAVSREVADHKARMEQLINKDEYPDLAIQPDVLQGIESLRDRMEDYIKKRRTPFMELYLQGIKKSEYEAKQLEKERQKEESIESEQENLPAEG